MTRAPTADLLIVSHDVVTPRLAGPGIRALELARALAPHLRVTLAVPHPLDEAPAALTVHPYVPGDWATLRPAVEGARALLLNPFTLLDFPDLTALGKPLAVDLYDPFPLENLHHLRAAPPAERARVQQRDVALLRAAIEAGDFFLCANSRQRDAWLGALMAMGRINPATADADPTLEALIAELPFGLPDEPFQPSGAGPHEHFPSLRPGDRIILWGGGLWDWLDPLTAIRAMPAVLDAVPEARLLFPGVRHPNPGVPLMKQTEEAMALADRLGLAGQALLFGDWVPYRDWPAYLGASAVALTLHRESLESRLAAVRSRVLSYIWAGLPIVASAGDAAGELIERHALGEIVPGGDVEATAAALVRVLRAGKEPYAPRFEALRPTLTWSAVAEPLRRFAAAPRRAADRGVEQPAAAPPAATGSIVRRLRALIEQRGSA